MFDLILDAVLDTGKMLPFLFAAYLLIEYIERRWSGKIERTLSGTGRWGSVIGAGLGLVPQCGFSAMAASLYASRALSAGTLVAVFLATSDEAIPVLLSVPGGAKSLAPLLIAKFAVAVVAGLLIDTVFKKALPADIRGGYTGEAAVECEKHDENDGIWLSALKHTVRIGSFVLLLNLLLGAATTFLGEDAIAAFVSGWGFLQPVVAGLVGLVPNCAVSILLTQLFAQGALSFGGLLAGLSTGAGAGLLVLLRVNKNKKQNAFIICCVYVAGVLAGFIAQLL